MRIRVLLLSISAFAFTALAQYNRGYYRFPAIHNDEIVFTSEGDLWTVRIQGGVAQRLTTHPGEESHPAFSPDGSTLAFSANYEGPTEVYTMPATGGLPVRRTFDGNAVVVGWTPDGHILYATRRYSTLPNAQLVALDLNNNRYRIPLSQASQGAFDKTGSTLYFTRLPFQGSQAKRYQGGTAQNIWKYVEGQEAAPMTADYSGTSKNAMWWNDRVYFLSDRDGTMNLWSMNEHGKDVRQHTAHQGWDIQEASLSNGRIVYRMGADLRLYEIASGIDKPVPVVLASDFDNLREHWVKNPLEYTTSAHVAPDGGRVAVIARGRAFVAPVKQGRLVEIPSLKPGRYREARFFEDGKSLALISTESGEVEVWKAPANGVGPAEQLTKDGKVLRWDAVPSPDGKWIAHQDKENQLWVLDTATHADKRIAVAMNGGNSDPQFRDVRWSPDSRWMVFDRDARNGLAQIMLYKVEDSTTTPVTSDRYDNHSACWSADGKWIYFLSDRALKTTVMAPWGARQPEPFFDRPIKIYALALQKGLRLPFEPADELHPDKPDTKPATDAKKDEKTPDKPGEKPPEKPAEKVKVDIDLNGLAERIQDVPIPAGNYSQLAVAGTRLCWIDRNPAEPEKAMLQCADINNKGDKPETVIEEIQNYEVSADGKKIMIVKKAELMVIDSSAKAAALKDPKALADTQVDLKNWTFSVLPFNEFKEAFADAWRLHRDYFYDRKMHGVNWQTMRDKYGELLNRVRDRDELNDLIASMVSELSALHTFVVGGDVRRGVDQIQLAALGARLVRDPRAEGYRVEHIYRSDPDRPDRASPLARPGVDLADGDTILMINGRDLMSVPDPGELLRNQAGKQVLLRVRSKEKPEPRDVVVKPVTLEQERDLRYYEWEYTRRLAVDAASGGRIGYVHLRAMGPNDINQWMEEYTPVFDREGLIVDVRHNGGGNIDSWILERLMRKAWMYWQPRVGIPYWNMQQAFRGHLVVLCDEWTGSDGEAFTEGFRRLGLGKVIGTRTWGGEIWLSASNVLADRGIATAAEVGVYGPERKWLIEGHGVDPDITIDNLPHAAFEGKDAQLDAAVQHLQQLIKEKPVTVPEPPDYPDKTVRAVTTSLRRPK
jgi:tricorn protease